MPSQSVRPSQFITTFGPGSILEGPNGPRVIYDLARSNVFHNRPVREFAIDDAGLSRIISNQTGTSAQIVRLPSNADHNVPDGDFIFETEPFPKWSLCVEHSRLYRRTHATEDRTTGCPRCTRCRSKHDAIVRSRREAIRFIQACKAGHMDDVDWVRLIRHTTPNCRPDYLLWQGGGASLGDVEIECPNCHAHTNLGVAYRRDLTCSACYPERGELSSRPVGLTCNQPARMMQRGATFLYSPEHISAITIPNLDTPLHQFMASRERIILLMRLSHQTNGRFDANQVREWLNPTYAPDAEAIRILSRYNDSFVLQTAQDVLSHQFPDTPAELLVQEFIQLQRAATHGHPSQPSSTPGAPPLFEVIPNDVRTDIPWPNKSSEYTFRVTPVSRLRVVMALLGYRRMDDTPEPNRSQFVSVQHRIGADTWYPGVELFGEGIFIDIAPMAGENGIATHPIMDSDASQSWQSAFAADPTQIKKHPVFVWWHTLAHRLIVALSVDSGYSSASIRERVYARITPDGTATGGILLYTVQPGGDGTLGGLIALIPRFERVLQNALERVDSCSNDPLCGEEAFNPNRPNGAICYACGLVSETSCEHRNMYLDRTLLVKHPLV